MRCGRFDLVGEIEDKERDFLAERAKSSRGNINIVIMHTTTYLLIVYFWYVFRLI